MSLCFLSYLAVNVIVTHPAGWDTRRVSTLELTGAAGGRSTLHFIRAVATVVLNIAHKVTGDAAAAGARELVWSTGDVTWRQLGGAVENVRVTSSVYKKALFISNEHKVSLVDHFNPTCYLTVLTIYFKTLKSKIESINHVWCKLQLLGCHFTRVFSLSILKLSSSYTWLRHLGYI